MLNITRRFHSNLLNQTLRLFLVFELVLNVVHNSKISKGKKRLEKIEKQRGEERLCLYCVFIFFLPRL